MPRSLAVQGVSAWIRWLRALLRKIRQRFPSGPVIRVWRLWIAAQKLRALVFSHQSGGSVKDPSCSPSTGIERVTDQDIRIIVPCTEPTQTGFDAVVADAPEAADTDGARRNSEPPENSQFAQGHAPVSPTAISPTVGSTSLDGTTCRSERIAIDTTPAGCKQVISKICPILPEKFGRYVRETISRERVPYKVPPRTMSYTGECALPDGWVTFLHPEGARYFSHPGRRIFTDVNVCEAQNLANLNQVVQHLIHLIEDICTSSDDIPPYYAALLGGTPNPNLLVDLVIDLAPWPWDTKPEPEPGYYYFVNHSERCPFWLQPLQLEQELPAWQSIEGPIQGEQLRHAMESQYWQHCAMFPNALPLTQRLISELRDCIVYAIGDISTSLTCTVSRSVEELRCWLSVVGHLEFEGLGAGFTFARLMENFAQDRFHNFHGLPCARLNQDQSVYDLPGATPRRSYWIIILSPLLFFAPEVYLQSLEKAYVDKTVLLRVWKPFIHKLNEEWMDFILFATVILNANVAFLSINSVDTLDNGRHSVAQIASYLSVIASIGAIILGQLLVRQNRTKFHDFAGDISASVSRRTSKKFGLELLALIWALPYSLLMWSMVFFFVSFTTACVRLHDATTRSIISVAAAVLASLVLWCIWDAWDMQEAAERPPLLLRWSQAIRFALHPSSRVDQEGVEGVETVLKTHRGERRYDWLKTVLNITKAARKPNNNTPTDPYP
ncbi:hypothetical protein FB451DRAFT_701497 [Mycena latifolia]|nr:hypothetical protein FB451DRAFT_701497 [Mycena latifolia]